ncbi:MAG: PilZ domain-containing protein [Magnetococcales bacterium]|nr:PilZ domain-containing protein [Magnetococcales bacterium]
MPESPPSPGSDQKREFVRVDDVLPLAWKRITPEAHAAVMEHFTRFRALPSEDPIQKFLSTMDVAPTLKQLEGKDPMLAAVLARLDMKLNLMIRLFHPGQDAQPMIPTEVNMSGGGIAFWEENPPFAVGDVLEMRLALSNNTLASFECYSRVVAIVAKNRQNRDKVACRFEPIMSLDRERIIQYIFKRQAELLRGSRQG